MRIYDRDEICPFRFTREMWGAFSNFAPLAAPIAAAPAVQQGSPLRRRRARRPPSAAAQPPASGMSGG